MLHSLSVLKPKIFLDVPSNLELDIIERGSILTKLMRAVEPGPTELLERKGSQFLGCLDFDSYPLNSLLPFLQFPPRLALGLIVFNFA